MSVQPRLDPFDPAADPLSRRAATGLAKIGLALKIQAWRQSALEGLTPTQAQILALLRQTGSASLTAIAQQLAVSAPTASDAAAALVGKRLVGRKRSADDGRERRFGLTARGRRAAARVADWPDFLAEAVDSLAPAEQQAFLRAIVKMIRELQGAGRIPVSKMCVTCDFFRAHVHPDPVRPHHCAFVDAPFGDNSLRLECPDHRPAGPEAAGRAWNLYLIQGGKQE